MRRPIRRPARRNADLPLGLRRVRHHHGHLDGARPDVHLRAARSPTRRLFTPPMSTGQKSSASVEVQVTSRERVPDGPCARTSSRQRARHQPLERDPARQHAPASTVAGGFLRLPDRQRLDLRPGTSARNIVVQPLPVGNVSVTAKIKTEPLTENYQQAGLRVYYDDNNWASVHMICASGARDFEFIYENAGNPRNEGADKLGGIPPTSPHDLLGAADLQRQRADGRFTRSTATTFSPVRPGRGHLRAGPILSSARWRSPTRRRRYPVASFDWIRFDPDTPSGGGGGGARSSTSSTAATLAEPAVERRAAQPGADGQRRRAAHPGIAWRPLRRQRQRQQPGAARRARRSLDRDHEASTSRARPSTTRPASSCTATTPTTRSSAASRTRGGRREVRVHLRERRHPAQRRGRLDAPTSRWTSRTTSTSGSSPTARTSPANTRPTAPSGRRSGVPAPLPANAQIGVFAFNNAAASSPGRGVRLVHVSPPAASWRASGPSRDDQFDGTTLDKDRWNAIVRDNPSAYSVGGGELTITTEPGDIYTVRYEPAAQQLHPPVGRPCRRRLGDRDEAVRHDQRRLWPGRPDRVLERRQLRQARSDLRRRQHRGSTASSCAPRSTARRSDPRAERLARARRARRTSGCV